MLSAAPLAPASRDAGPTWLGFGLGSGLGSGLGFGRRLALALALGLLGGGCRGAEAEQPIAGDLELCCKAAKADEISFVGCRAAHVCRATEEVWIRGPLTCTAAAPEQCEGGRCCALDLEALALRGGPANPRSRPAESSSAGSADARESSSNRSEPDQPEAAPVTPIPLDWSGRPTPVFIPKFVCPALEQGGSGAVVLWIEIDTSGRVTEAAIRESLDPECDALARDALLHAEFEPGLNPDGQPIATALRYRYEFGERSPAEP
jgi:TonB family protein